MPEQHDSQIQNLYLRSEQSVLSPHSSSEGDE